MATDSRCVVAVTGLRVELTDKRAIVEDVSFSIAEGEILGLVGESGSGKTTVSMALLAYTRDGAHIVDGDITLNGIDVLGADADARRSMRGGSVSYVAQDPASAFNPALRLMTQMLHVAKAHGLGSNGENDTAQDRIYQVIAEVGLPATREFVMRFPHQLSGGQLQRVGIAMALLLKPPVIVLDEPTTGLDVTSQATILALVRDLCTRHGIAALYVTHDLAVIADIADSVMVMRNGRVVEAGPVSEVFTNPAEDYTRELLAAVPDIMHESPLEVQEAPALIHNEPFDEKNVLQVRDLCASYGSKQVLHDISFDVVAGECLALVGESGSGKSTLSKALIGLHGSFEGQVQLLGQPVPQKAGARPRQMRRDMQYIFQSPQTSLNPRKTIAESIGLVHRVVVGGSTAARKTAIAEALDKVGLRSGVASMYPNQLSGGERQRVSIARALVGKPRLLICDEVTSALDVIVQASILELLRDLQVQENLSMIFVTHNLAVVSHLADRIIVMNQGAIVETGETNFVLNTPRHEYTRQLVDHSLSIAAVAQERWTTLAS